MSANFTPEMVGYTGQGPFRYWCQKVLPLVYDDSLSYLEVLYKITTYLNNVISDVANVETNVDSLAVSYENLQNYVNEKIESIENYVNDYFDNLDVQKEINNKLDEMITDGTMTRIVGSVFGVITPQMFGAVGDGVTDDSTAFQECVNYGIENNLPINVPEGRYFIENEIEANSGIVVAGFGKDKTVFILSDSMRKYPEEGHGENVAKPLFTIKSIENETPRIYTMKVKATGSNYLCEIGDTSIKYVYDSSDKRIVAGDIIRIVPSFSEYPWTCDNRGFITYGETNVVIEVNGDSIKLANPIKETFLAGSTVQIECRSAITGVKFSDFSVEIEKMNETSKRFYSGLYIFDSVDAVIENIEIRGCGIIAIGSWYSCNTHIDNCSIKECWTNYYPDSSPTTLTLYPLGYGYRFTGDTNSILSFSYGENARHIVDMSGNYPAHGCVVNGNIFVNTLSNLIQGVLNTHGPADECVITNNTVRTISGGRGITISGERMSIKGNVVNNRIFIFSGGNHVIDGNECTGFYLTRPEINDENRYLIIKNNTVIGTTLMNFAGVSATADSPGMPYNFVYGLTVMNNILVNNNRNITVNGRVLGTDYAYTGATKNNGVWTIDGSGAEISGTMVFQNGCVISGNYCINRNSSISRTLHLFITNKGSGNKSPDALKFGGINEGSTFGSFDTVVFEKWQDSAPTEALSVGSIVWNSNPAGNGYIGWVQTSAGWRGFGAIQQA